MNEHYAINIVTRNYRGTTFQVVCNRIATAAHVVLVASENSKTE